MKPHSPVADTQLEQPRPPKTATVGDLYRVEGKAELVDGRIVKMSPSGDLPTLVAANIYSSLREYVKRAGRGIAYPDGAGFLCNLRHRKSFCPDGAYYTGPRPANRMTFLPQPPALAIEVRSEGDYGPAAEAEMRTKRADYFAAGTQVVWDVDPLAETVAVFRASHPDQPSVYGRADQAEAEPAAPGWKLSVDEMFA